MKSENETKQGDHMFPKSGARSSFVRRAVIVASTLAVGALAMPSFAVPFATQATAMGKGFPPSNAEADCYEANEVEGGACVTTGETTNLSSFAESSREYFGTVHAAARSSLVDLSVGIFATGTGTSGPAAGPYTNGMGEADARLVETFYLGDREGVFIIPVTFSIDGTRDERAIEKGGGIVGGGGLRLNAWSADNVGRGGVIIGVLLSDLFTGVVSTDGTYTVTRFLEVLPDVQRLELDMQLLGGISDGALDFMNTAAFEVEFPTDLLVTRASGLPVRPDVGVPEPSSLGATAILIALASSFALRRRRTY